MQFSVFVILLQQGRRHQVTHQLRFAKQFTSSFKAVICTAAERLVKGPSGLGKGLPLPMPKGTSHRAPPAKEIAEVCTRMVKVLHARDDCRICLRERSGVDRLCALLTKVCFIGWSSICRQSTTTIANAFSVMRYNHMPLYCLSRLLTCCMRPFVFLFQSSDAYEAGTYASCVPCFQPRVLHAEQSC